MSINSPGSGDVHSDAPLGSRPKRKRRRMKKFRLDEISLVDRPAQTPARIAITKRKDEDYDKRLLTPRDGESKADFTSRFMADPKAREEFPDQSQRATVANRQFSSVSKRMALTSQTEGHAHSIIGVDANSNELAEVKAGKTSFVDGHTHDWVMDDAGNIIIAEADGHGHGISILVKCGDNSMDIMSYDKKKTSGSGKPAFLTDKEDEEEAEKQTAENGSKVTKMTDQNEAAETAAKLDEITKRADRAEAVVGLSTDQRSHFDSLSGSEQDEFLSKSSDERDSILKNLRDADPVVYTSSDGDEFRKSDDARLVKAAQRADRAEKRAEEQEQVAKRASFEKRATDDLNHMKGEVTVKADLLEAIETLPVEKREAVMEIVKAKDAGMALAQKRLGTTGATEDNGAQGKLDGIAKRLRDNDPTLTSEAAMAKALQTPEGLEAFAELRA